MRKMGVKGVNISGDLIVFVRERYVVGPAYQLGPG
jgi:hypothetical protein